VLWRTPFDWLSSARFRASESVHEVTGWAHHAWLDRNPATHQVAQYLAYRRNDVRLLRAISTTEQLRSRLDPLQLLLSQARFWGRMRLAVGNGRDSPLISPQSTSPHVPLSFPQRGTVAYEIVPIGASRNVFARQGQATEKSVRCGDGKPLQSTVAQSASP
jgi:hypothetical protein